ncbi:MAG: DUF6359 domain-containing protein [Thermoplasmata archaeon]
MQKDIVHTRVVSTLLIVLCIVLSAGLSGYFLDLYNTKGAAVNKTPIAIAGDSIINGYRGAPLTFNGNESYDQDGEIISYMWDFGDDFTGIGIKPTHTYDLAGDYVVTLTVTDNDGAANSTSITARISDDDSGTGLYTKVTVNDIIQNGTSLQGQLVMVKEVTVSDAGSYNSGYGTNPTGWVKFYVKDSSTAAALDIYCDGGATRPLSLKNGDIVTVTGIVELYSSVWEIKVRKDSTDKVELVSSGGGGGGTGNYTARTIAYIFSNWESMLDDEVAVYNATIAWQYEDGSWLFSMTDGSTAEELSVIMDTGSNVVSGLEVGSVINVYGIIMEYQDEPELKVRAGTDDRIEFGTGGGGGNITGNYTQATVNQLLTDSGTYNNTRVAVLGALVVDYYAPSYKKVTFTDNSSASNLIAFGYEGADIAEVSAGDYVDVYGEFVWYAGGGYFEIIIDEDTDDRVVLSTGGGDGGNITGNYTLATVNQLLTSSSTYNNTRIAVLGALVVDYYAPSYKKVTFKDNSSASTMIAFGYEGADIAAVSAGNYVDVYGEFVWYAGGGYFEIMIDEDTDDRVVLSTGGGGSGNITGNYTLATVNQLLTDSDTYNNTRVAVLGALVVDYYAPSYKKVTFKDNSSTSTMIAFGYEGADIAVISAGNYVDVYGELVWYAGGGYFEIMIDEDTDDRVVLSAGGGGGGGTGDYTQYTLSQLLSAPNTHENELIAILYATVVTATSPSYKLTVTDNSTASNIVVYCEFDSTYDAVVAGNIVNVYGKLVWYSGTTSYWEILIRKDTDDRVTLVSGGGGGGGGEGNGTGTKADPYNVAACIEKQNEYPYVIAWARGYIVGSVKTGKTTVSSTSDIDWVSPFSSATNVVIADDLMENNIQNCAVVSLTSGRPLRTDVNLLDNPENDGKMLNVLGTFRTYFSIAGIRDCPGNATDFELTGEGGGGWTGETSYTEATVNQLLTDSSTYNNTRVAVMGALVVDYYAPSYKKVTFKDNSSASNLIAFGYEDANIAAVSAGDYVDVYGEFVWYVSGGYFEIIIDTDTDDRVVLVSGGGGGGEEYDYTQATVNQLLTSSSTYNNTRVAVMGALVVDYYAPSYKKVTFKDNSSVSTLIAFGYEDANITTVSVGDYIDVYGEFVWYVSGGYFEMIIEADTDDRVIPASGGGGGEEPEPGNYTAATVNNLILNPATYLGTLIHITDAVVTDAYSYNFGYGASPGDTVMFYIGDASSAQSVLLYCEANADRPAFLSDGDYVEVYGYLDQHLGSLEIVIRYDTDDVVFPSTEAYLAVTVDQLLTESATYLGEKVCVLNALVSDAYSYNLGSGDDPADWVVFFITDASTASSLTIYCQAWATRPLELSNGDEVNVYGVLDQHFSTLELVVRNRTADAVVPTSDGYTIVTVGQLLGDSASYLGEQVCILDATVSDAYSYNGGYGTDPDNPVFFYITDSSTALSILVACEPNAERPLLLEDGDKVDVHAILSSHYGTPEMVVRAGTDDCVEVSATSGKLVYYCTGHGEATGAFTNFEAAISSAGYLYMEGNINAIDLENVKLLVISNPSTPYSADELLDIKNYVEAGGTLLLLCESDKLEAGRPENLNPILDHLGMNGRFNDDEYLDDWYCYDLWNSWEGGEWFPGIPYFNFVSYQNATPEYADFGCFDLDSTGITDDVLWLRGERICTIYNITNDIPIIRGSDAGYGFDNPGGSAYTFPYSPGSRPPVLAANISIGLGRVLYGGLTYTLSDSNPDGWADSNLTALVQGMLGWAAESGASLPNPIMEQESDVGSIVLSPGYGNAIDSQCSALQSETLALIPRRSVY